MTEWLVRRFVKDYQDANNVQVRTRYGQFAGVVGIICNMLLCLGKGAIGLVAGSVSIIADAVNNLSDAASNIISLFIVFGLLYWASSWQASPPTPSTLMATAAMSTCRAWRWPSSSFLSASSF